MDKIPLVAKMLFRLPDAAAVTDNPDPDELKVLAARMPNARPTRYDNLNVQTEVVNRSKGSTFIVTDEPDGQNQAISREEGESWAQRQDEYIAGREMVVVDGFIGNDPDFRTPARLYIEAANANIAGMQQQLFFLPAEGEELEPELTVIYTPNLKADGYPDDRLIAVDLEQGVTRVFNSDYFGESKKGGLRMWNKLVYDRGGIPLACRHSLRQDCPGRAHMTASRDRTRRMQARQHCCRTVGMELALGPAGTTGDERERPRAVCRSDVVTAQVEVCVHHTASCHRLADTACVRIVGVGHTRLVRGTEPLTCRCGGIAAGRRPRLTLPQRYKRQEDTSYRRDHQGRPHSTLLRCHGATSARARLLRAPRDDSNQIAVSSYHPPKARFRFFADSPYELAISQNGRVSDLPLPAGAAAEAGTVARGERRGQARIAPGGGVSSAGGCRRADGGGGLRVRQHGRARR